MGIKVCVSGVTRDVAAPRCCVGGVVRAVSEGHCGVSGVVRSFFISALPASLEVRNYLLDNGTAWVTTPYESRTLPYGHM